MQSIIILHSSDIHGHVAQLMRIGSLVEHIRTTNPTTPVFYVDTGDVQDKIMTFSRKTRGIGMHQMLGAAGCQASVLGNKSMKTYPMSIVAEYQAAAGFPILAGNVLMPNGTPIAGTQASTILTQGDFRLGVIGLTADGPPYIKFHGLRIRPMLEVIRREMKHLRAQGVDNIILLSHMGIWDDETIARELQGEIPLILGGHTHVFFANGRQIGPTYIDHIGAYGDHLGRIDAQWDGQQLHITAMQALIVGDELPFHAPTLAAMQASENQITANDTPSSPLNP